MIARLRLLVVVARPAVIVLLALYAGLGAARAGAIDDHLRMAAVMVVVGGLLLFSVAVNDLADERIDRVNLAGVASRPLVTGAAGRADMVVLAGAGAVVTVGAAIPLRGVPIALAGLAVSAAYSRLLSGRGAVASLVLPACYVAVPYLEGLGRAPHKQDLLLLAGLYVGFIGRILLKDFRDVRGDALFGKRTFLVRYGRRATCAFSAVCWVAGSALIAYAVPGAAVPTGLGAVGVLVLLRGLATDGGHRRDERLISAIAVVGRSLLVVLLVALSGPHLLLVGLLTAVFGYQAMRMAARGPERTRTVPVQGPVGRSTVKEPTAS